MARFAVILPAAGSSTRFGDAQVKKPFAHLAGRAVWLHAAEKFTTRDDVVQTLVVISPEDREWFGEKFAAQTTFMGVEIVTGGADRSESVANALARVRDDADFVAIHDAARPLISELWIDRVFEAAEKSGAAILGVPVAATLKRVAGDKSITETVSREGLYEAQTPQVFRKDWLIDAFSRRTKLKATDDAQLLEAAGKKVTIVPGSPVNFKITTQEDLKFAEHALAAVPQKKRLGPLHPFDDNDMWR